MQRQQTISEDQIMETEEEKEISEMVMATMKNVAQSSRKKIAKVAATLLKKLVSMEKTFHNVKKNKAIRDAYRAGRTPASTPEYKAGFDTPCSRAPADLGEPWQLHFGTCTITIGTDSDTTLLEVKEAMYHARHAAYAEMDVQIGKGHVEMLQDCTSYEAFKKECKNADDGEEEYREEVEAEEVSPLEKLSLGSSAVLWKKESQLKDAAVLALYKKTVDKARAQVKAEQDKVKSTKLKKENLVTKMMEKDPGSFISCLVRQEFNKIKGKGKGGSRQEFNIEYENIITACATDEYIDANEEGKRALISQYISRQKNGSSPGLPGAGKKNKRKRKKNNKDQPLDATDNGKGKGLDKGKGKGKKGKGKGKGKEKGKGKGKGHKGPKGKGKGKGPKGGTTVATAFGIETGFGHFSIRESTGDWIFFTVDHWCFSCNLSAVGTSFVGAWMLQLGSSCEGEVFVVRSSSLACGMAVG